MFCWHSKNASEERDPKEGNWALNTQENNFEGIFQLQQGHDHLVSFAG